MILTIFQLYSNLMLGFIVSIFVSFGYKSRWAFNTRKRLGPSVHTLMNVEIGLLLELLTTKFALISADTMVNWVNMRL